LNAVKSTPNRWDMMMEIRKMQVTLDRIYDDLRADGKNDELAALSAGISNLNYTLIKLNNNRSPE
jgi:hypothetical protein